MSPSILLLAVLSSSPRPYDEPTRDDLVAEAIERFAAADHRGAIEAFERAHALEHRPVDLYNIGRIYEDTGELQRAREYYQRFLSAPELTPEEREEGEARLRSLPPAPEPEPEPASPPSADVAAASSASPSSRWRGPMIAGATLLPIGVLGLLGGGIMGSNALDDAREAKELATPEVPLDTSPQFIEARQRAVTADLLMGLGGAVAVTGATVLAVGLVRRHRARGKAGEERPPVEVAVAPLGAGLRLHVRF